MAASAGSLSAHYFMAALFRVKPLDRLMGLTSTDERFATA